jgi:RHS repeat-associated protein
VEFRYGYTGREQDGETGLDYYRARYYDASNGRFISEDPLGFGAGDGNLTRYVGNNPTNFTDPSGECPPCIAAAAAGAPAGLSALECGLIALLGTGAIITAKNVLGDLGHILSTPRNPQEPYPLLPFPRNPLHLGDHRPETYGGTPGAIPPGIPPTDLTPYNYPQLFPGNVAPPLDHHVPVFNSDNQEDDGRRDGAGKNGQHGRPAPPSLDKQLEDYRIDLANLRANQGSKKEKDKLNKAIINIQKEIKQAPKGENHNQKAKGSNGGAKR